MKYCKICKTAAKDTESLCAKGHALSVFGSSANLAPTATTPPPRQPAFQAEPKPAPAMYTLQGEVQRLEEKQRTNVVRARLYGGIGLLTALAIVVVLYQVYARTVLAYAVLENITIEQDPLSDWKIHVSYDVKTPGRVAFDRKSGTRWTEKVDEIATAGHDGFSWSWPSDPETGVDLNVLYRGGWLRATESRHFDVTTSEKKLESSE